MNPKLSFIIPCYNVERYVERCVESIYAIDLCVDDFEVICVNDNSPDGVLSILYQLEQKYPNLKVVNLSHRFFLGGARNEGLKAALGQYVWFVDSDDTVAPNNVSKALKKAINEELDVLCFNYRRVDDAGIELSRYMIFQNDNTLDGISFCKKAFGGIGVVNHMGYVWRFFYRKQYLTENNFWFPEGVCWEDTVFMPETLLRAERVGAVDNILYSYRVNPESISGTFIKRYPAQLIYEYAFCAGKDLLEFADRVDVEDLKYAFRKFAIRKYINGFVVNLCRTSREERNVFYQIVRKNRNMIQTLQSVMSWQTHLLLRPIIGRFFCEMLAIGYSLKHHRCE